MRKTGCKLILFLFLTICLLTLCGIGHYSSASAAADLRAELESIYGVEYTGKSLGSETEDMTFHVTPKSFFFTNWTLRQALGIDYLYSCSVQFTTFQEGVPVSTRTITYQGIDPMGTGEAYQRAYLDLDSKTESMEVRTAKP